MQMKVGCRCLRQDSDIGGNPKRQTRNTSTCKNSTDKYRKVTVDEHPNQSQDNASTDKKKWTAYRMVQLSILTGNVRTTY